MKTCQKCGTHTDGREFCSTCFEFARAVVRFHGSVRRFGELYPKAALKASAAVENLQKKFALSIERREPPFSQRGREGLLVVRSHAAALAALEEIDLLAAIVSRKREDHQVPASANEVRAKVVELLEGKERSGRRPRFADVHAMIAQERNNLLRSIALPRRPKQHVGRHHVPRVCGSMW